MTLAALRWARPVLRQAVASSQAGPSSIIMKSTFTTTARRSADDTDSWATTLNDLSPTPRASDDSASSTPSSNIMPGFRSSASVPQPSTSPYMQRQYPNQSARKAFNLHIQSTRNNTILCFTDPEGAPITRVTSGQLGFKHTQRSGYEAGHQTAMRMFTIIGENRTKWRVADLNLVFRGFGLGRDAVHRALLTDEATQIRNLVRQVKDATRIKVGGVRPKKRRML